MAHPLDRITPEPARRGFIVASVGSGKSTLGCTLLGHYRAQHPRHRLYIVDPKQRFFAKPRDGGPLFPDGAQATRHGRRDGVTINATKTHLPLRWHLPDGGAVLIQDTAAASKLYRWLFDHHDIRQPALLYLDESFDVMRGTRSDAGLRRLIQMGRELGIGCLIINQRPSWIDRTFMSEADLLYYGQLHYLADRKTVLSNAPELGIDPRSSIPRYTWWLIDQVKPERSLYFALGQTDKG